MTQIPQIWNGQPLVSSGLPAVDPTCCCAVTPPGPECSLCIDGYMPPAVRVKFDGLVNLFCPNCANMDGVWYELTPYASGLFACNYRLDIIPSGCLITTVRFFLKTAIVSSPGGDGLTAQLADETGSEYMNFASPIDTYPMDCHPTFPNYWTLPFNWQSSFECDSTGVATVEPLWN